MYNTMVWDVYRYLQQQQLCWNCWWHCRIHIPGMAGIAKEFTGSEDYAHYHCATRLNGQTHDHGFIRPLDVIAVNYLAKPSKCGGYKVSSQL